MSPSFCCRPVKPVARSAVLTAWRSGNGFAGQPVDAIEIPGDRSVVVFGASFAIARGIEGIEITRLRCGQLLQPVQLVVGKHGMHAVGIRYRCHVVRGVVGVPGRLVAGESARKNPGSLVLILGRLVGIEPTTS